MLPQAFQLRVEVYQVAGFAPFTDWLDHLPDMQARARIRARIDRLEAGNLGRYEDLGDGLRELKIDWGRATGCIGHRQAARWFCF